MTNHFLQRSNAGHYENSKFSQYAEIFDRPTIKDSFIYGGQILDSPQIFNSSVSGYCRISGRPRIKDSHISGTAQVSGYTEVKNSVLAENCIVSGHSISRNSEITGNVRLLDWSGVNNCIVSDNVILSGNAVCVGTAEKPLELNGWLVIEEGIWKRPPIQYVTDFGFTVTESINRNVIVGCINNTVEKWLDKGAGREYGFKVGLDKSQIDVLEWYVMKIREVKDSPDYDMYG